MMRSQIVLALVASVLASPYPQGVTQSIAPSAAIPTGCSAGYEGKFGIAVITDIPFKPMQTAAPWRRDNAADHAVRAAHPQNEPTVTLRSTRYHTTTVTVEPANGAPTVAADAEESGGEAHSRVVSQHESGQVQITPDAEEAFLPAIVGNSRLVTQAPGKLQGCAKPNSLQISLKNGILKDARGRTGYIADNRQFQFDDPPQHGALYTAGFSVCNNGTLALGGTSIWWQCLSGDFYNLYDKWIAPQCNPVHINVIKLNTC